VFLLLGDDDIVLADKIVALVRGEGETSIFTRGGAVRSTRFTPATVSGRSERFWKHASLTRG
jgi:hypothetical protein